MKTHTAVAVLIVAFASGVLIGANPARAQQPCPTENQSLTGEAQVTHRKDALTSLTGRLVAAYEAGNSKEEEELVKKMEGYASHHEVSFSQEEQNKMEELAQRPEVKTIIEALYTERRAEEVERAHRLNVAGSCFFYPNPMLQDYVNKLGQSMVPRASSQYYAFRIVTHPLPQAWSQSTGSVYVTIGMVALLDNEAQLAYVLAHEIGHIERQHMYAQTRGEVLQNLLDAEKMKSAKKKGMIVGALAASVGGIFGGKEALGGLASEYRGATAIATDVFVSLRQPKFTEWSYVQEAEADEFAARTTLQHDFDVREAPKVFVALENTIHRDDRIGMGFHYGLLDSLADRRQKVQGLLEGILKKDVDARSKTGLQATSPNFALLMAEVKRDNGRLALEYDLFDEARKNLEDSIALRSSDPTAHFNLGRVYKLTARSPDEEQKAMDHFMQAIRLDIGRNAYPQPHLYRALALLKQNDQTVLPEAQKEIKTYIELYKVNHAGNVPPAAELDILYDYLSLTGDNNWAQLPVVNVAQAQGSGNQVMTPAAEAARPPARKVENKKPSSN